jgi:hypothetical protein
MLLRIGKLIRTTEFARLIDIDGERWLRKIGQFVEWKSWGVSRS